MMMNFLETFAGAFPDIDDLTALHKAAEEAEAIQIDKAPNKPQRTTRSVPRQMSFDKDHITALAEAMGISPDEISIILTSAIKYADNPIIIDAFKKLTTATKLCTDVNDRLRDHHAELRQEEDEYNESIRYWRKRVAAHKNAIDDRDRKVLATKTAYRRAWLKLANELETRVNAVAGDTSKMREDDAFLYRRAKKGTKINDPIGFLKNQKGEKCIQLLSECRHELERKLIERGVKKSLKLVKDRMSLEEVLDTLDQTSANHVFDAYIRKVAFMRMHPDGYIDFDSYSVHALLSVGEARGLRAAEGWREHLEWLGKQKANSSRSDRYTKGRDMLEAYRMLQEAIAPDPDF